MAEELKRKANSLLHAGVNLIQQVGLFKAADSSDDERVDAQDAEDFITNGGRGILSFPVVSLRTGKSKVIHLHLYKAKLMQYHEGKKRVYSCSEIICLEKETTSQVMFEMRQPIDVKIRQKRLQFDSEAAADRFVQYVDFLNEFGKIIKQSFNHIDYARSGRISKDDLAAALRRVDLRVDDESVQKMLMFGCNGHEVLDYTAFFHIFLNGFVSSLRDCLQDWLILATAAPTPTCANGRGATTMASPTPPQTQTQPAVSSPQLSTLPGEIIAFAPRDRVHYCIFLSKPSKRPQLFFPGLLLVTNFRVVLLSLRRTAAQQLKHSRYDVAPFFQQITIPLASISKISVAPPRHSLFFYCKDHRVVRVTLSVNEAAKQKVDAFLQLVYSVAFQPAPSLFAFRYQLPGLEAPAPGRLSRGWTFSDVLRDYERMDLTNDPNWQIFHNEDYGLIDTYPRYLALPRDMTRAQIVTAAQYRSRNRLPTIVFRLESGTLLLRSAQPLAGLTQKTCEEELRLLEHFRMQGALQPPGSPVYDYSELCILDCRGILAATLNKAAGKGTESTACYTNTELVFGNIDNIHVMRTSAAAFAEALASTAQALGDARELVDQSMAGYQSKLEESGWLRYLRIILVCSVFVAEKLHFDQTSVLVHCSDGWDRTPQVTSLVQLLLDPFYRTVPGFATLVEKDWCAFGHKFQDRCGHGQDQSGLPDERSPVFLQFLECTYQLLVQFPAAFQFNEDLLVFLADHVHSCMFGTFLGNSEKERMLTLQAPACTVSVWDYVLDESRLMRFLNPAYCAYPHPLWPSTAMHSMRTWERYWLRWDVAAHPNPLRPAARPWHDDWGQGCETDIGCEGRASQLATPPPPPPPPPPPHSSVGAAAAALRAPVAASPGSTKLRSAASSFDGLETADASDYASLSATLRPNHVAGQSGAHSWDGAGDLGSSQSAKHRACPVGSPTPPVKPERRRHTDVNAAVVTTEVVPIAPPRSGFRPVHVSPGPLSKGMGSVQDELNAALMKRLRESNA